MLIKNIYQQIRLSFLLLLISCLALAEENTNVIKDIDYKIFNNKIAIMTVKLTNTNFEPSVIKLKNKVTIKLTNTTLPEKFQQTLQLTGDQSPIQSITNTYDNRNTLINITQEGDYDISFYQLNNTFQILFVDSATKLNNIEKYNKTQILKTVSVNLPDTDVITILETLANEKNLSLITSEYITGKMTVRMHNVPWEQAINIVLKAKKLNKELKGELLTVKPVKRITMVLCDEKSTFCNTTYPIKFINPEHIIKQFQNTKSTNDEGTISFNKSTNTIYAYQTKENLNLLHKIIREQDRVIPKILLKANFLNINNNYYIILKQQPSLENIELLLKDIKKQGTGEIIYQSKMITDNKIPSYIEKPQETKNLEPIQLIVSLQITPEVINNYQIKLIIEVNIQYNNKNRSLLLISKHYERIVRNNETITLDQLGYLHDDKQSSLAIIITPEIIPPELP